MGSVGNTTVLFICYSAGDPNPLLLFAFPIVLVKTNNHLRQICCPTLPEVAAEEIQHGVFFQAILFLSLCDV